jgi:hypothetical protein
VTDESWSQHYQEALPPPVRYLCPYAFTDK